MADNDKSAEDSTAKPAEPDLEAQDQTASDQEATAEAQVSDELADELADELTDEGSDDQAPKTDADLSPAELLVALGAARDSEAGAQDTALRAKAEMENLRRRSAREVENAHKFALEKFSKALIPVFESLEKAESSKGEATDAESAAAVLEGVSLSLKLFKDTLEKQGVSQFDPHGEPFDPNLHEAVAMVPMPSAEPNSIIEVIRKGFDLNGRLIQAAQVVVAKAEDA